MGQFNLQIVTPDGEEFSGMADSLLVKTTEGDVEILRGHTDYFGAIDVGRMRLRVGDDVKYASVSGGFISVFGGVVRLAATTLEFSNEIDIERARAAKERAEQAIATAKSDAEVDIARAKLMRALSRIDIYESK